MGSDLMLRYADHLEGRAAPRFLYYFVNSYQVKINRTCPLPSL
jgi:hypothetical protein